MTIREAIIKIENLMEKNMVLFRRIEDRRNDLIKGGKKKYLIAVPAPLRSRLRPRQK